MQSGGGAQPKSDVVSDDDRCLSRARRGAIAVLMAIIAWPAAGCASHKVSDRDLVLVDPAEAIELVGGRKKLLGLAGNSAGAWVDPRGPSAFRSGHIPGAINLPFQDVAAEHHKLRQFDVLIVYGDDYRDPKANGMSKRLLELGFKNVRTLRGGLTAWTEQGNSLESGFPSSTP